MRGLSLKVTRVLAWHNKEVIVIDLEELAIDEWCHCLTETEAVPIISPLSKLLNWPKEFRPIKSLVTQDTGLFTL